MDEERYEEIDETYGFGKQAVEPDGPYVDEYQFMIYGFRVPYVTGSLKGENMFDISVDHRFVMPAPISNDELQRWLPMLANAMAVAAGYTHFGAGSRRLNPFRELRSGLTVPDGDKRKQPHGLKASGFHDQD